MSLALLAATLEVKAAIALLVVPALATNIWQALIGDALLSLLRRLWSFLLLASIVIWFGAGVLARSDAGLITGLVLFWAGVVHVGSLFGATVFVGLGNGLTMPSSNAGVMSVLPRLAGSASGLAGALTIGGGAVLTSITGAVVTEATGATALLGLMLACTLTALTAAHQVRRIDQREGRTAA